MGSSPFTATNPFPSAQLSHAPLPRHRLARHGHCRNVVESLISPTRHTLMRARCSEEPVLVAFSGGSDSTALLLALREVAPALGISWVAAHADHGLDFDSPRRAHHAGELAAALGTRLLRGRLDDAAIRNHPNGLEAGARRARYQWLTEQADTVGARFILTGHHADDQAETVLLRLRHGSGWMGLGGMRRLGSRLLRPFLGLRHAQLATVVGRAGLIANDDPANRDPRFARTFVRHHLLPHLRASDPSIVDRLGSLAARARVARRAVHRHLAIRLDLQREAGAWSIDRRAVVRSPPATLGPALDLLAQQAGLAYPPGLGVRRELIRQMPGSRPIGCDVAAGWRLEGDSRRIRLLPPRIPGPPFAYTLKVPGSTSMAAGELQVRAREVAVADWMFRHAPDRVGLGAAFGQASRVEIRSRRPGDRIRPLGCVGHRKLKDLLIDRRIPRHQRGHLPLIVADGCIAWVPGVALDHRFRIREGDRRAWQVEMIGMNRLAKRDGSDSDGSDTAGSDVVSPRNLYLP